MPLRPIFLCVFGHDPHGHNNTTVDRHPCTDACRMIAYLTIFTFQLNTSLDIRVLME